MAACQLLTLHKTSSQAQRTRGYLQATQIGLSRKFSTGPLVRIAVVGPLSLLVATCCSVAKIVCRNRPMRVQGISSCGNLQTKLLRCCGGAAYLCTGYAHWSSGWAQPNSPPQSPELPCDRCIDGTTKQSAGLSERGLALTEESATVSDLATGGGSPSGQPCGLAASEQAAAQLPMTPCN